jgi:hypothetical protein
VASSGVFDGGGHDVVALAEARERDAGDGEVVGLAAACREHDAFGGAAEQRSDLAARPRDRGGGGRAVRVSARRVAEVALEVRPHRGGASGAIGVVALWSR